MTDIHARLDTAFGEQGDHVPRMNPEIYGYEDLDHAIAGNAANATPEAVPSAENVLGSDFMSNNSTPVSDTGALERSDVVQNPDAPISLDEELPDDSEAADFQEVIDDDDEVDQDLIDDKTVVADGVLVADDASVATIDGVDTEADEA